MVLADDCRCACFQTLACNGCGTVIDLDLTVKRRDPNAPIRIALDDVRCPALQQSRAHAHCRISALSLDLMP